jgi:hypothetical protein
MLLPDVLFSQASLRNLHSSARCVSHISCQTPCHELQAFVRVYLFSAPGGTTYKQGHVNALVVKVVVVVGGGAWAKLIDSSLCAQFLSAAMGHKRARASYFYICHCICSKRRFCRPSPCKPYCLLICVRYAPLQRLRRCCFNRPHGFPIDPLQGHKPCASSNRQGRGQNSSIRNQRVL